MASKSITDINDSELRTRLQAFGVDVGPISGDSIRSLYIKKLEKLLDSEDIPDEKPRTTNRRKSTKIAANAPLRSPRKSVKVVALTDDSDSASETNEKSHQSSTSLDNGRTSKDRVSISKKNVTNGNDIKDKPSQRPSPSRRKSLITPSAIIPGASKKSTPQSASNDMPPPMSPPVSTSRNRRSHVGTPRPRPNVIIKDRSSVSNGSVGLNASGKRDSQDSGTSDSSSTSTSKTSRLSSWINNISNGSSSTYPSESVDNLEISDADFSDVDSKKNKPTIRLRTSSMRPNNLNGNSNIVCSVTHNNDMNSGDISNSRQHYRTSWIHYIPNILILSLILLFLVGVALYFFHSNSHVANLKEIELKRLECNQRDSASKSDKQNICFNRDMLRKATNYTRKLFDVLSEHAAHYYCMKPGYNSPHMTVVDALHSLEVHISPEPVGKPEWKAVLYLILHMGQKHWSMAAYNDMSDIMPPSSDPTKIKFLECLRPRLPTKCRVSYWFYSIYNMARQFVHWCIDWLIFLTNFLILFGFLVSFIIAGWYIKSFLHQRALQHQEKISDIVLEVKKVLKEHLRKHHENAEPNRFMAVEEVRTIVANTIFNEVRQDKLWSEVCDYINNTERDIGVENKRGVGEVWYSKAGWQGSALPNRDSRLLNQPPQECLRVRNMLPGGLVDTGIKHALFREILTYCNEVAEILHMGATHSNDEGHIYLKFATRHAAESAYRIIDANYFDKRLIFADFVSLDEYYRHFPEARRAAIPLTLQSVVFL